jgi:hypothetical protein
MDDTKELSFSVNDELLGEQLSPENISLPLLIEFAEQVSTFLKGSSKTDLKNMKASIKAGSFALGVEAPTRLLEPAIRDYQTIRERKSLSDVDPVRARIIESWQSLAIKNNGRIYKLFVDSDDADKVRPLVISSDTDYQIEKELWANVELYTYGSVFDLGGKSQPNVHLQLTDGTSVRVQANIDTLAGDRVNRLYSKQLVRIKAQQNLKTKEYRNQTLLSFEKYSPHYDEDEFQVLVKQGRLAWKSVKNATEWVENLRGNYA